MLEAQNTLHRVEFFEQIHQQFLYMKGYGTYAYVSPNDVDRLYDTYMAQQKSLTISLTQQPSEVSFIRAYIKSI